MFRLDSNTDLVFFVTIEEEEFSSYGEAIYQEISIWFVCQESPVQGFAVFGVKGSQGHAQVTSIMELNAKELLDESKSTNFGINHTKMASTVQQKD